MSIELALLAAHVPSLCYEERAPEFQKELVKGLHIMRERIEKAKADAIVLISCHFPTTFHHYVDATPRHSGVLTAMECPDLISDVPYDYPGDQGLADELVAAGLSANLPIIGVNDPTYIWDYGTVVPLRYLAPQQDIAVVNLSVCLAASLEETFRWGQTIRGVLENSDKRAVFVSSGALSHRLVRGRHHRPSLMEKALDDQFVEYLLTGDYATARDTLEQYSKLAGVESGGRHLAALLGVLGDGRKAEYWGYGQSSGSGNAIISFAS
ncbi:extradiol ring-cleavage dioxygenase [Paenibacillus sp.]|uniref:DODA-type extradiol aromatic ring-opening family dioxygenase n=1 Tax=Paenibacillus sp. TaxID=58172 RepID=UPI002D2C9CB4|nr:extradiol ring-cleavage dioxygenase [Paenibacillus sp.]HZG84054.1 extradiol ring-cleavage dioxygenase [Paenibacillus sp.]